MKYFLIIALLFLGMNLKSEQVINIDSVYKEGMLIYKNAKASWVGNEILIKILELNKETANLGGYLSYPKDSNTHFIFYNKEQEVVAETYFDSTFKAYKDNISFKKRKFNNIETRYYDIKQALAAYQKTDTIIKYYENTGMNIIPIEYMGKTKCYILSAPQFLGQVIYGNDYVIEFSKDLKVEKVSDIHKSIIPIEYAKDSLNNKSYHTHTEEVGYLPTPTDIAITFLYGEIAQWSEHFIYTLELTTKLDIKTKKMEISKTQKLEDAKKAAREAEERKKNKK